ncbi:MAG: hypothetical protein PHY14_00235 [Candidatus Gracilibacteria bacterium]|nr:hypothetical protein [Candidatus Gracilibacteria bacterium]
MDKITKFLLKLSLSERIILLEILEQISNLHLDNLDVKKLAGETDLFRVRKGKIRIIFRKVGQKGMIVNIDYRGDVYKDL